MFRGSGLYLALTIWPAARARARRIIPIEVKEDFASAVLRSRR